MQLQGGSYKLHKRREKAIRRSIALAKYYTEDADLRELERRLLLVAHSISLSEFKGV